MRREEIRHSNILQQVDDVKLPQKLSSPIFEDFNFSYVCSIHSPSRTLASIKVTYKNEQRIIENARESFPFKKYRVYDAVNGRLAHRLTFQILLQSRKFLIFFLF